MFSSEHNTILSHLLANFIWMLNVFMMHIHITRISIIVCGFIRYTTRKSESIFEGRLMATLATGVVTLLKLIFKRFYWPRRETV